MENNQEPKKRRLGKWKWPLLAVVVLLCSGVAYYGYALVNFGMAIQEDREEVQNEEPTEQEGGAQTETEPIPEPPEWEGTERVNILLLGGDGRGDLNGRTDTMLVLSVDPETKEAHLFSLLRDAYVDIPGRTAKNRINAAYAFGGTDMAMETVSQFLGQPIQYYVYVDFQGFVELVDAVGGVEYYVEQDMYYTTQADGPELDIDLKEGLQTLDGSKALQYVRFRYDAGGDYRRAERQRNFLTALADEVQETTNLLKLPSILNRIEPYIETNMTLSEMVRLGTLGYSVRNENIETVQVPPNDLLREETIGGAWLLTFDADLVRQYVQDVLDGLTDAEEDEETAPEQTEPDAA